MSAHLQVNELNTVSSSKHQITSLTLRSAVKTVTEFTVINNYSIHKTNGKQQKTLNQPNIA
jgi:hypothetical protein